MLLNMPQEFEITDEDIHYAESILLSEGCSFDDERVKFIKNLDTIDLQAVPGSGKTTALLAKLLILEQKLPIENGAGILVLSHTNIAIDEIKKKLQPHCPKLFSYPNFIGTIQSFVNKFLAVPAYCGWQKKKPIRIDNEIFIEQFEYKYPRNYLSSLKKRFPQGYIEFLLSSRPTNNNNLVHFFTNKEMKIPKVGKNTDTFKNLVDTRIELWKKGILNFNEAYLFANNYLKKDPNIIGILRNRFNFVFVDEVQDIDLHQYQLLETLFFEGNAGVCYQRIGDINQSIYNFVKAEDVWVQRENKLCILGSHRLTPEIADIVNSFAHISGDGYHIEGKRETINKPHILVFTDETLESVVPYFDLLISDYHENGRLPNYGDKPIKVIAWNTEWKKDNDRQDKTKIRLIDYYPRYEKNLKKSKQDYNCLQAYLVYFDKKDKTLRFVCKNIINAILKCLRLEGVYCRENSYITKASLYKFLSEYDAENGTNQLDELNCRVYLWSIKTIEGKVGEVQREFTIYLSTILKLFDSTISKSSGFLSGTVVRVAELSEKGNDHEKPTYINAISSVHSVKGETHCATLYLESSYEGKNESELLSDSFLFSTQHTFEQSYQRIEGLTTEIKSLNGDRGTRKRQKVIKSERVKIDKIKTGTKMVYVGVSRPTDLLCFAIHKDRFDKMLSTINRNKWEIIEVT